MTQTRCTSYPKEIKTNETKHFSAELKALRELHNDNSTIVLPANKRNATIIMNTYDYKSKMFNLFSNPAYRVTTNSTNLFQHKINDLIKNP